MTVSDTPLILILFFATLVSFYGYGSIVIRFAFRQWTPYVGLATLLGLLLFLGVSGYIELFHLGSFQAFRGFVILGICLALLSLLSIQAQRNQIILFLSKTVSLGYKKAVAIALAFLLILAYCLNMLFHDFNSGDD